METSVSDSPLPAHFGVLLKRFRLAAGLSQEALAERARLSARAISAYERGQRQAPYRDTVVSLVQALGLPPEAAALLEASVARRRGPPAGVPHALLGLARLGGRRVPSAAGAGMPPLVGRAGEVALLERHLGTAGPPSLLLAGEPGIGKSRLLHEMAGRAEAAGWTVLQGGCQRHGGHEPYAPISSALQHYLHHRAVADLRADLAGCAGLVRLLPELAAQPNAALPGVTLPPEQERRLMVAAVVRFLDNVAGPAGTLLLLDDLQWAGPDALDLLMALLRSAEGPLRVIGAYRDAGVRPNDPLGILLADLAHAGLAVHHTLGPLAPSEATDLLTALLADAAEAEPALQQRVVERAGGVPFFLVSYARGLRAGVGAAVPWDLAQGLRQRVAALPAGGQTLLGVAAVAGRVAPRRLLAAVLAWPEDEVLSALDAACAAQLLREEGIDTYHFPHDVIREVVEADLGAARRAMLHRQVAEALEANASTLTPVGEPPVELLAFHYAQAAAWPQALAYLMKAGDKAAAAYANAEALTLYTQALQICDTLGDTTLSVAAVAAQRRATVQMRVGKYSAALADYERMRELAHRLGDRRLEGRALVYCGTTELEEHAFAAAEQTLRAALASAEEGAAEVRLGALVGLVHHHVMTGRLAEAETALRAAEEVAPQVQDLTVPRPESWRSWLHNWAGRFDEAIAEAVRGRDRDAYLSDGWAEALARGGKGEYQQALALLTEVLAVHKRWGSVPHQALNTLGWVYGEIQNHACALAWNTRALAAAQETDLRGIHFECLNHARLNLGDTLAALGRLDEAAEQFQAVEQVVRHPPDAWMLWRYAQHFFHSYGELRLTRGDAAQALAYADECLHLAEQTNSRKNVVKGRRLRGQALLAEGEVAAAEQELACALKIAQEVGNPPQLWKSQLAWGDLRTSQGRVAEARAAYHRALEIAMGVAAALTNVRLRETFLSSTHIRHIRRLAGGG